MRILPGAPDGLVSAEARYYRRLAAECMASARACADEAARQSLLYLAESYLAMADTANRPASIAMFPGSEAESGSPAE